MNRKKLVSLIIVIAILAVAAWLIYTNGSKNKIEHTQSPALNSNTATTTPITDGTEKPRPAVGNNKIVYAISGQFTNSQKHDVICFVPDPEDAIKLAGDSSIDFCFTNQDEAHKLFQLQNPSSLYSDTCLWIAGEAHITITNSMRWYLMAFGIVLR